MGRDRRREACKNTDARTPDDAASTERMWEGGARTGGEAGLLNGADELGEARGGGDLDDVTGAGDGRRAERGLGRGGAAGAHADAVHADGGQGGGVHDGHRERVEGGYGGRRRVRERVDRM